jgi:alkylation response protein AidB-like acyl-CoA dehydrogenase
MNVHIPEVYGGLELGAFEGMIIGEELCWGCSGIGTAIAANGLGHGPVIIAGTEEQKRKWLPPLVDEVLLTSFALTEPNAGSDVFRHRDHSRPRRRRLRHERLEDVHHERRPRLRGSRSSPRPTGRKDIAA